MEFIEFVEGGNSSATLSKGKLGARPIVTRNGEKVEHTRNLRVERGRVRDEQCQEEGRGSEWEVGRSQKSFQTATASFASPFLS